MKLEVIRDQCRANCTIGKLLVNGEFNCYTLEDVVRPDGVKVYGETAIPTGTYVVDITFSNRFQRDLPILLSVPNFESIRIHPGNTAADTHGCLLVGTAVSGDTVIHSRDAFNPLFDMLVVAHDRGELVTITYREDQ
jgi:hypothetical protein